MIRAFYIFLICYTILIGEVMAKPKSMEEMKAAVESQLSEMEEAQRGHAQLQELEALDMGIDPSVNLPEAVGQEGEIPMQSAEEEPPKVMVRLDRYNKSDTKDGQSTFQPDVINNKLHKTLNDYAVESGKFIDLSGADRSDGSGLSEKNHHSQNAVDISLRTNPSYFKNGKFTELGKGLISSLNEAGFRVASGDGHIHVDGSKGKGVFLEPDGSQDVYNQIVDITDQTAPEGIARPEQGFADQMRERIAEAEALAAREIPEAKAPPEVDFE